MKTPSQLIVERATAIQGKLTTLGAEIERYRTLTEGRTTWGHAGNLGHVEEELDGILSFLRL
jgi:hypothetical protein